MNAGLPSLQTRIGHAFRQPQLLELALTHPSCLQENPGVPDSNQRLEFLGDAVLQLVLTEALYQLYPDEREGLLSQRRAALSKGPSLSALARDIGLDACLRLSTSEENTGGRMRASALEDAFEALIGAVYLDGGFAAARRVLLAIYGPLPDRLAGMESEENPKGRLQEKIQPEHGNNALRYDVARVQGEAHAREYEVVVYFKDTPLGAGRGTSKKQAEEAAARAALRRLETAPLG
jgi:ribonuclease-3